MRHFTHMYSVKPFDVGTCALATGEGIASQ